MKTKKMKKGLLLGLSAVMVGVSILVASSTATASMSASTDNKCTGPLKEYHGSPQCAFQNNYNCPCDGHIKHTSVEK